MASNVARGVSITVKAKNGQTGFTPAPPAPPAVSCAYPLNASEAEITSALGGIWAGKPVMTDGDQTGEYAIQSQLPDFEAFVAAPAGIGTMTATPLDFSTGKKAVELQVQQMDANSSADPNHFYDARVIVVAADFAKAYTALVRAEADGTFTVKGIDNFGDVTVASGLLSPPSDFAVVVDADAGTVAVRYAGTDYATASDTLGDCLVALQFGEYAFVDAPNAGNVLRARAETNAANFLGDYGPGTTDPCGNLIS